MGLFSFMKNAGRSDDNEDAIIERNQELIKANKMKRYLIALELPVENLRVGFDDGVATVSGTAASQEVREKVVLALGNTEGVAQVDDQLQVAEESDAAEMYTVVAGDTLSKIAKQFYGDPMRYTEIFDANTPMLTDPNLIYPGQVLRIP